MIEFENVNFKYENSTKNVIEDITFKIEKAEFVAIVGKNGAGKTTLIKHINGLLKPDSGSIKINNENIAKKPISKLAKFVGLAFQNPNHQLFAQTVYKELEFGPKNLGVKEEERKAIVEDIIKAFQINHLTERAPLELSGGERRLVSIASVLTMNQQILVLDEPTYGQDYKQKRKLGRFLQNLVRSGITVVVVSHDMDFILDFVPRMIVLSGGKILADGATEDIFVKEEILEKADLTAPVMLKLCKSMQSIESSFPISVNEDLICTSLQDFFTQTNKMEDSS